MNRLQINTADILLENYEVGKGKIIISDLQFGSWSFYWGSMGSNIEDFIQRINSSYFAGKLCNKTEVYCGKSTARNIRKFIKDELSYYLPWYKYLTAQKELREKIKEIEKSNSQEEAMQLMTSMHENLMCYDLDYKEEKEFKSIVEDIFDCEPWNFLGTKTSNEYNYLIKLHKGIKTALV